MGGNLIVSHRQFVGFKIKIESLPGALVRRNAVLQRPLFAIFLFAIPITFLSAPKLCSSVFLSH